MPRMRLRDAWRVPRTLYWLLRRPQDLTRYLRFGPTCKKSPLELGLPWWSFGAIDFMGEYLRPEMRVFEYGPGGSTLFLAQRVQKVTSTEDERSWCDELSRILQQGNIKNVELQFRPYDFWAVKDFETSAYLNSIPEEKHDVIVVDGKEWSIKVRDRCFWHAEKYMNEGGAILVDDSWRYPELKRRNRAKRWTEWRGTGPCRPGVTSTCVFFY